MWNGSMLGKRAHIRYWLNLHTHKYFTKIYFEIYSEFFYKTIVNKNLQIRFQYKTKLIIGVFLQAGKII